MGHRYGYVIAASYVKAEAKKSLEAAKEISFEIKKNKYNIYTPTDKNIQNIISLITLIIIICHYS